MQNWIEETKLHQQGLDALYDRPHSHPDCCELLRVDAGTGTLLIGDRVYRMEPGVLYCIPAGMLHCTTPTVPDEYVRSKIVFYSRPVLDLLALCDPGYFRTPLPMLPVLPLDDLSNARLDRAFSLPTQYQTALSTLQQMSCLTDVLLWLWQQDRLNGEGHAPETSGDPRIAAVLTYINENLAEELHIDEIAALCHLSKYHLCRLFRENTGLTIMQYVLEQRLAMARELLLHADLPISQVAMQTGFSSFSYFCHAFQKKEQISPTQFRKRYGG